MRNFKIHWKGYPHHHLPRIRCASSSRTSAHNRSLSHDAAEQVLRRPFGAALIQERIKRRLKFGRRRVRSSRSSSSAARARKRGTVRAQQHIQVFGWETPQAEVASRTSKVTLLVPGLEASPAGTIAGTPPGSSPDNTVTQSTVTDSHDGAVASVARKTKVVDEECLDVKKIVEIPVYWRSTKGEDQLTSLATSRDATSPARSHSRQPRAEQSGTVSGRKSYCSPQHIDRNRTFDHRIDPKKPANVLHTQKSEASPSVDFQVSQEKGRKADVSSPQSHENQPSHSSIKSAIETLLSDTPARTPSQRKALRQFTKGLELYVQATASLPKKSLIPSPSVTTISADTIQELKPYHAEFKAAGLSITSDEQKRKSISMASLQKPLPPTTPPTTPPETPPKDDKWLPKEPLVGKSPDQDPRQTSPSSGTVVMGWTPLHESTTKQQSQDATSYTLSSDHTVIEFTPLHLEAAESKQQPLAYATPAKKSLPWLRKPALPPRDSFPPSAVSARNGCSIPTKNSSPSKDKSTSYVTHSFSEPAKEIDAPKNIKRSSTANQQIVTKTASHHHRNDHSDKCTENLTDTAAQSDRETPSGLQNKQKRRYVDDETQTDNTRLEAPSERPTKKAVVEDNSQAIRTKSEAFIGTSSNYVNTCNPAKMGRAEDQTTQTSFFHEQSKTHQPSMAQEKRYLKPAPKQVHRISTFPITATPLGRLPPFRPFRGSMALRSLHRTVDEEKTGRERVRGESSERTKHPPTRKAPIVPAQPKLYPEPNPIPIENDRHGSDAAVSPSSLSEYIEAEMDTPKIGPNNMKGSPSPTTSDRNPDTPGGLTHKCTDPRERYSPCLDEFSARSPSDHKYLGDQSSQICICEDLGAGDTKGSPKSDESRVPETVKKAPISRSRPCQDSLIYSRPKGKETKLTLRPIPINLDSCPLSDGATTRVTVTDCHTPMGRKFSDKDVFRGLHVATAAACDEDVDKWIEDIMGARVRRFLADLSAFDSLGTNALSTVARRAAQQRRNQVKAWEVVREKKLSKTAGGFDEKGEEALEGVEVKTGRQIDKKIGLVAGDERVPFDRKM